MKRRYDEVLPDEMVCSAGDNAVESLLGFVAAHAGECGYSAERTTEIGKAVEEALVNILRFACSNGQGEIKITCGVHEGGGLSVTITDTGEPFNMLLAGAFPDLDGMGDAGQRPSTSVMKRFIKDIEYKRTATGNTLIFNVLKEV